MWNISQNTFEVMDINLEAKNVHLFEIKYQLVMISYYL